MTVFYFTTLLLFAAFEPPQPADPIPSEDLLPKALEAPLPDDRYGLLTVEDARAFALINFFPKKTASSTSIKHQASLTLGNANLHLGQGTCQDLLEAPAWMHLLRYDYHQQPLPDDLAHEYQNIMGIIALSSPNGSHVAIDGDYNHRADRIPNAADLNVNNTQLDIHIEDSSSRDYKLSGIVSTSFANIHDPVLLQWDDSSDLGGSIQWIKSFPSFFQLETKGSFTYKEIRKAGVVSEAGNNAQLKTSLITAFNNWAFSWGGLGWFSSLPVIRARFLPQCEISWRVARLTGTALYFGGYFDDKSVGSELVERPYARMGDKLATNEKRKATWKAWHSFGEWVLLSFAGGYSEERLAYQWIANNGFVSPLPMGRMRAWVANPKLEFTPAQSTQLSLALDYRHSFAGEELNFIPEEKVTTELSHKIMPQLEAMIGENYYSTATTGDLTMPQLPARWETFAGATFDITKSIRIALTGENLADNSWWEIPGRRGAGVTLRTSVYAAF
jgi:hypothetical protein